MESPGWGHDSARCLDRAGEDCGYLRMIVLTNGWGRRGKMFVRRFRFSVSAVRKACGLFDSSIVVLPPRSRKREAASVAAGASSGPLEATHRLVGEV